MGIFISSGYSSVTCFATAMASILLSVGPNVVVIIGITSIGVRRVAVLVLFVLSAMGITIPVFLLVTTLFRTAFDGAALLVVGVSEIRSAARVYEEINSLLFYKVFLINAAWYFQASGVSFGRAGYCSSVGFLRQLSRGVFQKAFGLGFLLGRSEMKK